MKITDIKVIVTCPGRNYVFVKIVTDEPACTGIGDATLNGRELAVASALKDHIVPLLADGIRTGSRTSGNTCSADLLARRAGAHDGAGRIDIAL